VITEELYNFCLNYAENIGIRHYGTVNHKGYKITYSDTIPTILRTAKYENEIQHNDELKKKGTDFIVFVLLWGFERKYFYRDGELEDTEINRAKVDKAVLEFLVPRMKDKQRFLDDFGGKLAEEMSNNDRMRFELLIDRITNPYIKS